MVWPDLGLGVAAEGDAASLGEVLAVAGAPDSWPKKGSSRAWPREPAANKMPKAPVTTAIRLLIVRTAAAFLRTACGSRLNDEPVNVAGPTPARGAAGSAAVAAFSVLAGSAVAAAVAATAVTVGMAAVSLAWAARFRSAARAAARVVGAAVVGVAAGVGSAVELKGSKAGAAMNGSLSLARRRPVALVLSPATWARRG
ncbi:hypothetical protein [Arthrobacter sp. NA-172]|uniref:hypothetical protein n=1 Tax=Arthrobacter sp. NA-172 TaxID=3367524 RepID=UPI00375434F4